MNNFLSHRLILFELLASLVSILLTIITFTSLGDGLKAAIWGGDALVNVMLAAAIITQFMVLLFKALREWGN